MGMFDSFYFKKGVLPDNKVPEDHEFQTKDLRCLLDVYKVSKKGIVVKNGKNDEPINEGLHVYSHEFLYENGDDILNRKYLGCRYQEYKIIIVNSKVVHAEKVCEEGYEDPDEKNLTPIL